jgi:hypothetical protein
LIITSIFIIDVKVSMLKTAFKMALRIVPLLFINCSDIQHAINFHTIKHYAKKINNGSFDEACFAIQKLGDIGDRRAVDFFISTIYQCTFAGDDREDSIVSLLAKNLLKLNRDIAPYIISEYNESIRKESFCATTRFAKTLVAIHDSAAVSFLYALIAKNRFEDFYVDNLLKAIDLRMDNSDERLLVKLIESYAPVSLGICTPSKIYCTLSHLNDSLAIDIILKCLDNNNFRSRGTTVEADSCLRNNGFNLQSKSAVTMLTKALKREKDLKYLSALLSNTSDTTACDCLLPLLQRDTLTGSIAKALAKIGCKNVIPAIYVYLTDWNKNKDIAEALKLLKWQPQNRVDTVHLFVAQRNLGGLKKSDSAEIILFNDISANASSTKTVNAFNALIAMGNLTTIPKLVETLNRHDLTQLAVLFANSGNNELEAAAADWAARHGYYFQKLPGFSSTKWGSF